MALTPLLLLIGLHLVTAAPCNNQTHFACVSSGVCIPLEWICDGVSDCSDSSDEGEGRCAYLHECPRGTFNCNDGDCVLARWKCNGQIDCHNGRDEVSCGKGDTSHLQDPVPLPVQHYKISGRSSRFLEPEPCEDGYHRCRSAGCVHPSMICDGQEDCPLGDDEPSTCPKQLTCPPNQRKCADDDACMPKQWWCDGESDCDDGSDEHDCPVEQEDVWRPSPKRFNENEEPRGSVVSPGPVAADSSGLGLKSCLPHQYRCRGTNKCIEIDNTCDGNNDCPDADDERGMCGECDHMACSHRCRSTVHDVVCMCPEGMVLSSDHHTCVLDDPCNHHSRCSHFCQAVGSADYVCKCDIGFALDHDQHRCIPQIDALGGELLISVGNEIRVSPLHSEVEHPSAYSVYSALLTGESMYHLAWDVKNQFLWMAVAGHYNEYRITKAVNGLHRPLRRGFAELGNLQYDWVNDNIVFITGGRSEFPAIRACKSDMLFCSRLVRGVKTSQDERGRKQYQLFRGLAIHPQRGLMCWIEVHHLSAKIKCSNLDGSDVHPFEDNKLLDPRALVWDTTRNDLYIADAGNELIERINYDTRERSIIAKVYNPYAMAFFNGFLYYSESEMNVVKSIDVSLDHHMLPHIERTLPHKPFGLAVNHTLAQNTVGGSACLDIECAYVCVTVQLGGTPVPRCLCPDGYETDVDGGCVLSRSKNGTLDEDSSFLDLTYMAQLCEKGYACGVNGECVTLRDDTTQEVRRIHCSCEPGFTGYACELVDRATEAMSIEEEETSVMGVLMMIFVFLIVLLFVFYYAHGKYEPIRHITDAGKSALADGSPRIFKSVVAGVESHIQRIRSRTHLQQGGGSTASFSSPMFAEGNRGYDEIPSDAPPALGQQHSVPSGVRAVFDNFENPSFDGSLPVEVSYTRKFSGPGQV